MNPAPPDENARLLAWQAGYAAATGPGSRPDEELADWLRGAVTGARARGVRVDETAEVFVTAYHERGPYGPPMPPGAVLVGTYRSEATPPPALTADKRPADVGERVSVIAAALEALREQVAHIHHNEAAHALHVASQALVASALPLSTTPPALTADEARELVDELEYAVESAGAKWEFGGPSAVRTALDRLAAARRALLAAMGVDEGVGA